LQFGCLEYMTAVGCSQELYKLESKYLAVLFSRTSRAESLGFRDRAEAFNFETEPSRAEAYKKWSSKWGFRHLVTVQKKESYGRPIASQMAQYAVNNLA